MVLSAANAFTLTTNAVTQQTQQALGQEISLAEQRIRNAAGRQLFKTVYNATLIGNPPGDPGRSTLTTEQQTFYQNFIDAGFQVQRDSITGFWLFQWSTTGAEGLVRVYRIRTTVTPGPVQSQTIGVINNFFTTLVPAATSRAQLAPRGGNINEADFGASGSVFYEYTAVANQADRTDHRSDLRAALVASGLGYHRGSYNVAVYKVA